MQRQRLYGQKETGDRHKQSIIEKQKRERVRQRGRKITKDSKREGDRKITLSRKRERDRKKDIEQIKGEQEIERNKEVRMFSVEFLNNCF